MIRNYIVIALRNLWRHKVVTAINIVGMSIGFGVFLSFWSWISFDLSSDKFHVDLDRMYNMKVRFEMNGSEYVSDRTGGAFSSYFAESFPEIEGSCRLSEPLEFELGIRSDPDSGGASMKYINEKEVLAVDSSFYRFFSFKLIEGNIKSIFSERNHIVITRSLSNKLFGKESSLDKEIRIGERGFYTVVGVAEDPPANSSIQFEALLGFHMMEELGYPIDGFGGTMFYSFFKLKNTPESRQLTLLNERINVFVESRFETDLETYFFLDSFKRLHLYGENKGYLGLYLNLIMSFSILLIACINFINLSTAYSLGRLKEIAIRKSAGASRRQLVLQFLGETYILLLIAMYLGMLVAEHFVPFTGRYFDVPFELQTIGLSDWAKILAIYSLTGLIAGLYPALKIAGFKPKAFFYGKHQKNFKDGKRSRKVLVVLQFTFSILFILVAVFVIRQYSYLREADLGFHREDVIYIPTKGKVWENYELIKHDLEALHFVKGVASGSEVPVKVNRGDIEWGEREGEHNKIARILWTDHDFLSTMGIDLLFGEYYSPEMDSLNYDRVVVNQSLVDVMGWEDPIGQSFFMWDRDLQVIGVIENISFFPFRLGVFDNEALILLYDNVSDLVFVRMEPGSASSDIIEVEKVFREHNPEYEFAYEFVSDFEYEALESSDGLKFLFKLFSALGIFISAIGLIGLSIHSSKRRTKEVGIRKSMGASSRVIMKLLLSEFIKLVLLSNLIAMPVAYLLVRKLFQFFSYSVDISVGVFISVLLISLSVSLITVFYQAFLTARSNPITSLRYE